MDVNAIDLTGLAGDPEQATALEVEAADNLKRVRRAPAAEPDWAEDPGLDRMTVVPRDQDGLAPDRGVRSSTDGLTGCHHRSVVDVRREPPLTGWVPPSRPCRWWAPGASRTVARWKGFQ